MTGSQVTKVGRHGCSTGPGRYPVCVRIRGKQLVLHTFLLVFRYSIQSTRLCYFHTLMQKVSSYGAHVWIRGKGGWPSGQASERADSSEVTNDPHWVAVCVCLWQRGMGLWVGRGPERRNTPQHLIGDKTLKPCFFTNRTPRESMQPRVDPRDQLL